MSTTPAVPVPNLPPVTLILMGHLHWRISPQIFEKIPNDTNVIFRDLGEDDSLKPEAKKSRDTVP
jgi:hypothetical protein